MNRKSITLVLISLWLAALTGSSLYAADQRVYLTIGSAEARKIKFAVPEFTDTSPAGGSIAPGFGLTQTLTKSLEFHGIIETVPTLAGQNSVEALQRAGADYGVLGRYTVIDEAITIQLRLYDLSQGAMLFGKEYQGALSQAEEMIFTFTDAVINELTGVPGIASTQIAFVSQPANSRERELFTTNILGSKLRQVTRHRSLVVSPRFTRDGNFLAYTSYHSGNPNLYITDLRQSKTTQALSRRRGMNLAPAWYQDDSRFVLTLSYLGNPDLFLLNRDGKVEGQLTKDAGINVSPTISPDGTHMVFVSDRSGKPNLYLTELKTGKVRRLTFEGSENVEPDWSPTEDRLAFTCLRGGIYQLCTMNPFDEDSIQQITKTRSNHEMPAFSPDGNQIIFAKRDGANHKISAILKNGAFERILFSFPGSQSYPRWARKSY